MPWRRSCRGWPGTPRIRLGVHTWYQGRFGVRVAPLGSAAAGVATWPETATAVAVCLRADDGLEVLAPCGLADLLGGVCRRNPCRVTVEEYRRRLVRKRVAERWPKVVIIDSYSCPAKCSQGCRPFLTHGPTPKRTTA
jgi:uncharacterized protein